MKKLLIIIAAMAMLMIELSSCSQKHWQNRGLKKGWVSKDTTYVKVFIPADSSKGQTDLTKGFDTLLIKELDSVYITEPCPDKEKVRQAANKALKRVDIPMQVDSNSRYEHRMWVKDGKMLYDLKVKEVETTAPCPPQIAPLKSSWWNLFWVGFAVCFIFMTLIIYLLRK